MKKFFCKPYFLEENNAKVNPLKKTQIFHENFFVNPTFIRDIFPNENAF